MRNSTRAALAIGLGLVGVAGLVAPSMGQQAQDASVRPAASNGTGAAAQPAAPKPAPAAVIGTIDMEQVLKNYDGFRVGMEGIEAEGMARQNELMKMGQEMNGEMEKLRKLNPGSPDQSRCEQRISELKAKGQALKEQAQLDLSRKEAEVLATTYSEIQRMADGVAKQRGMNMVVQAPVTAPSASNPKSIEQALFRTLLVADKKLDLTNDVTYWLNYYYKEAKRPAPKNRDPLPPAGAAPAS
ncbi:MAG TPA: OmpH family outer membrane protein, partial [Isosphaeraceae bacterium]